MRLYRILPVIAFVILFSYASAQDVLTPRLDCAMAQEWINNYPLSVRVLKYKGDGKDDNALDQLSSGTFPAARELYKIGKPRPNDAFWIQMATAGAVPVPWTCVVPVPAGVAVPVPPAPAPAPPGTPLTAPPLGINCESDLSNMLDRHLGYSPKDLGKAATDSDTSSFLALSDLLRIPPDGIPANGALPIVPRVEVANVYRNCFSDPTNLFTMVKRKLGQIQ